MVRENITETEFIKQRFKDIIGVKNLFDGIVEYIVEEDWSSDNVLLYRFRNNKNIGLFEMAKEDLNFDTKIPKLIMTFIDGIGTVCLIIIYSIILANIKVLKNMPLEYTISLALTYLYPLIKIIKSKVTGFSNINEARKTTITGAFSILPLALAVISVAVAKRAYLVMPLYILILSLSFMKYTINLARCMDMREFE